MLEVGDQGLLDQDSLAAEAADLCQIGGELQYGLSHALLEEDATLICWLERQRHTGEIALCTAPLEVAEILQRDLFEAKESVILTSATLSADGQLRLPARARRPRRRGGAAARFAVRLPELDPDRPARPTCRTRTSPSFVAEVSELLIESIASQPGTRARAVHVLRPAQRRVRRRSRDAGAGGHAGARPRHRWLAAPDAGGAAREPAHRAAGHGVVLGGRRRRRRGAVAARDRALALRGADATRSTRRAPQLYDAPFEQYALPQAVLRFRQGFGRLIRSKTDRGVLLVLDRRLRGRRYGEAFLRSLPRCTLRDLPSGTSPAPSRSGWTRT